jgi:oligopeptide transport system substrate-binding protein
MIGLKTDLETIKESSPQTLPLTFHQTFYPVYEKLKDWCDRFPHFVDNSIFSDHALLYLIASKKYLDHRNPTHLFRLILSMHLMQKKLLQSSTFSPHLRHLEIRWIPTNLLFPFSLKPVLGCLIGFNLMNRYEVFDEENIVLALQKYLPQLRLVKGGSYNHTSQNKNLKIFYFEIEKKNGTPFSLIERNLLKNNLEEKVKKSIQTLTPTIFMGHNDEEIYKNILVLSQEIDSFLDLPQASITLDQQTGKVIVFRITLVYISPFHHFSLKDRFFNCTFVSQRVLTVRHLENHPIEAHIFCLHLAREPSLLRSDGSLDFYAARQKVVELMHTAIGEFRDYNGGILIQQQELLHVFKENFPEMAIEDPELMESFFHSITPMEKQVVLPPETFVILFKNFLENRKEKLINKSIYSFKTYHDEKQIFLVVRADDSSLATTITNALQEHAFNPKDMAYNIIDTKEGIFFNCVLFSTGKNDPEALVHALQETLHKWYLKMRDRQVLRIGLEHSVVSLDPRIGGEGGSGEILRLLFDRLMRFNKHGKVENSVAESVEISPNLKEYTFRLRSTFWNDGSPVSAYDFEYAWKNILSPDFQTSFAYFFYPIKNAQEAKEGKVSPDQIGIHVIDDRTLKVELVNPTPSFLQSTAHTLYSPVHRFMDEQHPQWPYECEKNYPCNGPFQLKINESNQGYQLVKNPLYWDANNIQLDQITLSYMKPARAIQAFQKNEIDWVGNPFGGWHTFYTPKKEDNVVTFPNCLVSWYIFNTKCAPFHHRKLRQAIAYAIDRNKFSAGDYLALKPAFSPLLPQARENSQSLFPDYDGEKARKLFDEALDELNITREDLPPFNLIFHEKGAREATAQSLKDQFQEILGIECKLKPLSWKAVFRNITEGNFQMALMLWGSYVDDPIYTFSSFKSATEDINMAKWEHPEVKRLLKLTEGEINPFQRSANLMKIEEILSQEMPIIPLFYQPFQALVKKDLTVYCRTGGPFNIAKSFYKKEFKYDTSTI